MTAPISGPGPGASLRASGGQPALPLTAAGGSTRLSAADVLLSQLEATNARTRDIVLSAPGTAPSRSVANAAYAGQQAALALPVARDSAQFSAASVLLAQLDADSGSIQDIAMLLAQPPASSQDAVARLSVLLSRRLGVLLHQDGLATANPLGFRIGPQGRVMLDPATHPDPARVQALIDQHPDLQALARYLMQAGPIQLQTIAMGREPSRSLDLTPAADTTRVPWPLLGWLQSPKPRHRGTRRWPAWAMALLATLAVLAALALL